MLSLEPGQRVTLPLSPSQWTVESCTIDGMVVVAELRPTAEPRIALPAQSGQVLANVMQVEAPVTLALFDVPSTSGSADAEPQMLLAASSETPGWRATAVDVTVAGHGLRVRTPARKSVLGRVIGVLGSGDANAMDDANIIEVELIDRGQWLTSCDDQALARGANLALIGREVIQFGDVVAVGPGRFRLRRLIRGRLGSGSAIATHQAGEIFVLASADQLSVISLPAAKSGVEVLAQAARGRAARAIVRRRDPGTGATSIN